MTTPPDAHPVTPADEPLLDTLRAWADGALQPAQARALEARLAADPALACDALAYRAVHRLTGPLVGEVAPCGIRFEALPLGDRHVPAWRRWPALSAAAALLLLLTGLALRRGGAREHLGTPPPSAVRLAVLHPRRPLPTPDARLLAGYRPVREGRVEWLREEAEARALAQATGRRVLLYAQHPECPLCRALERGAWRAPEVLAWVEAFVPLQVDVTRLPPEEMQRLFEVGWPYLAVTDASGATVATFPGQHEAATLADALRRARPAGAPEPTPWDQAAAAARESAQQREAAEALSEARSAPAAATVARALLRSLAARLAGTAAGDDLRRVLEAWPEGAPFPTLTESER